MTKCCPPTNCITWELSANNDSCMMDRYSAESLNIAGATINVFPLLGIHEQNKTTDVTGNGKPLSSESYPGTDVRAVYDRSKCGAWKSLNSGNCVLQDVYIGYDFGVLKMENGRDRYGIPAPVRYTISNIKIQQSSIASQRATKCRIERSDDGIKWFGCAIVELPDNDLLNDISFKVTAPGRMWRLRPVSFNGASVDGHWEVRKLYLTEYDTTMLQTIQDNYGWLENRDREYQTTPIKIKGFYDLLEKESDLTPFGFSFTGSQFYITCNFTAVTGLLGRPPIIGDILELPSEAQFDPKMQKVLKYLEVIDVSWSAEGYTPGWQPTLLRLIAEPMLAKQETMDIVGDFADKALGVFDIDNAPYTQVAFVSNDRITQEAKVQVPQHGTDTASQYTPEQSTIETYAAHGIDVQKIGINQRAIYVEDGLPKNGEAYSEGTEFPTSPYDKQYHRMVYSGLAEDVPPRLYRYSADKGRWIYLETDKRQQFQEHKPDTDKLLRSKQAISTRNLGKRK